ncbi:MAG TPA: energy transducer TonB, partial [Polyangiales bacterium]|nr:energy transducer TonB [Polyangiales bacterium]
MRRLTAIALSLFFCVGELVSPARAQESAAIQPPRLLNAAELEWPREQPPPTGPIELVLTVDSSGMPTDIELATSYGELADQAVRRAAEQLRFEPARRGEETIAARIRLQLAPPAPEPPPQAATP